MNVNVKNITLVTFAAIGMGFQSSAFALLTNSDNTQKSTQKNTKMTVTENTPDHVLLQGKDFDKMAKVKEPSTRLTLTVENIPYEIGVSVEDDVTILHVPALPQASLNEIEQVYKISMNKTHVVMRIDESVSPLPQISTEGAGTRIYSDTTGQ